MHTPRMRPFSSIVLPRSARTSFVRLVFHSVIAGGLLTSCRSATQPAPSPSSAATATAPAPDPSRFQQDVLLEGVFDEPTELAVAYDGRVFVIERHGTLSVFDPRTHTQRVITKLAVNDEAENGLIGIALDPAFLRNHWIYLNRTVGLNHRLARFTLDGDSLRDERVLLEVKIDRGCCHTGGSLAFNRIGELFVSYGDNSNPFTAGDYAPIDPTPGKFLADALRSSANTQDLRGKILRIRPIQNGTYAIPDGNLFADPKEGRPEIYTMGHRNPYRISVDQHTGWLYWGEVGPDAQKDSEFGSKGFDEVNQAKRPGNFGWPMFIGDNRPFRNYNFTTKQLFDFFDPKRPENTSPNNTGARILPPPQPAMIWYPYERTERFPLVGEGSRTAMAGPVYHYGDYERSAERLPAYYDRKFIHYDWMRGWLMAVTFDAAGNYQRMEPFLSQFKFDHPVDMELGGSDGALYVLEYGTYWNAKNANARLSRITYHPGNRPPVARLVASRTVGAAPLTVELSRRLELRPRPRRLGALHLVDPRCARPRGRARLAHLHDARHQAGQTPRARPRRRGDRIHDRDPRRQCASRRRDRRHRQQLLLLGRRGRRLRRARDRRGGRHARPRHRREQGERLAVVRPERRAVSATTSAGGQSASDPDGLARMRRSDCLACHGIDNASLGPSYVSVAQRYQGQTDARHAADHEGRHRRHGRVGRPRHAAASRLVGGRPPRDGGLHPLPRVVEAAATRTRGAEPARGVARRRIPADGDLRRPAAQRRPLARRHRRRDPACAARASRDGRRLAEHRHEHERGLGRHVAPRRHRVRRHRAPVHGPARSHRRIARDRRAPLAGAVPVHARAARRLADRHPPRQHRSTTDAQRQWYTQSVPISASGEKAVYVVLRTSVQGSVSSTIS